MDWNKLDARLSSFVKLRGCLSVCPSLLPCGCSPRRWRQQQHHSGLHRHSNSHVNKKTDVGKNYFFDTFSVFVQQKIKLVKSFDMLRQLWPREGATNHWHWFTYDHEPSVCVCAGGVWKRAGGDVEPHRRSCPSRGSSKATPTLDAHVAFAKPSRC